mmetsp:Transcript_51011/g.116123  ORF Transcript_51011/g.116123 Transcript_51011/m.116123 type:complete len:202 (-) Transcript_51011:127-732(-)
MSLSSDSTLLGSYLQCGGSRSGSGIRHPPGGRRGIQMVSLCSSAYTGASAGSSVHSGAPQEMAGITSGCRPSKNVGGLYSTRASISSGWARRASSLLIRRLKEPTPGGGRWYTGAAGVKLRGGGQLSVTIGVETEGVVMLLALQRIQTELDPLVRSNQIRQARLDPPSSRREAPQEKAVEPTCLIWSTSCRGRLEYDATIP